MRRSGVTVAHPSPGALTTAENPASRVCLLLAANASLGGGQQRVLSEQGESSTGLAKFKCVAVPKMWGLDCATSTQRHANSRDKACPAPDCEKEFEFQDSDAEARWLWKITPSLGPCTMAHAFECSKDWLKIVERKISRSVKEAAAKEQADES